VALLFGNETAGLSNAEVQRCQRTVFIPANPEYTSLNLASAVQLLCYELRLAAFDGLSTGGQQSRSFCLATGKPSGQSNAFTSISSG
jgi:tRNA C32,U32 (ribose-2'-O)-methylase TrmJ